MTGIARTLKALVSFDHYCWLFLIVWFAAATVFTFLGMPAGTTLAYAGIVIVLATNLIRLLFLAVHFKESGKPIYLRLTLLLVLALAVSILIQLWIRK